MANLTASLAQDNYKSTLSQAYNWAVWTIYVKNTPTVTFPAGKKVFLTINPEKSNMQVVRVSARDSALKTITVDSIAVNKWSGTAYTQQSHAVGSKVVISIPYAVWEELDTVTTDKLDINGWNGLYYASTAARDAALWANWVPTTDYRMVRAWSVFYNYNLRTGQWESVDTWTATPAMTTTSLWTGEISTQAETEAQTLIWSVWPLVPTNATINPANITWATPATGDKFSFADISDSNYLKSGTLANLLALVDQWFFGDGSDWDVTTVWTVTLTSDMYYNNLVVNTWTTLNTAWYRVFVKWTISWTWTINRNGNAWGAGASWASGTAWVAATTLWQGSLNAEVASWAWGAWGNSGVWAAWTAGTAASPSLSTTNGVAWGAGGTWVSAWGAGWAAWASTRWWRYNSVFMPSLVHPATAQTTFGGLNYKGHASSGWGWGWGSNTSFGGWGWGWGWNWGLIRIAANTWNFTGTVTATWGVWWAGWSWVAGISGWWGWWGWGNWGTLFRIYRTLTADATITLTGGAGWAWGWHSASGTDWTAWTAWASWETISIVI